MLSPFVRAFVLCLVLGACAGSPGGSPLLPKNPIGLRYRGYDGAWKTLGALRGRPVLVEVVATYAGPALVEVERIRLITKPHGEAVVLVLLVLDDAPEMAAIFAETFEVPQAVGRVEDPAQFVGPKGPFGPIGVVPTGILLDQDGRILVRSDGPWPPGVLEEALFKLLTP